MVEQAHTLAQQGAQGEGDRDDPDGEGDARGEEMGRRDIAQQGRNDDRPSDQQADQGQALLLVDGRAIGATEATQALDGKVFQRWSRHYTPANPWVVGEHNLGTHILTIESWLTREFEKCPAA